MVLDNATYLDREQNETKTFRTGHYLFILHAATDGHLPKH
jgi:hypothetical protein